MTFLWTPASLILTVVVLAAAAGCCLLSWKRSGYSRVMGWLEILRFLLIALVLVTLNQPEIPQEIRPTEQPTLVVLYDTSESTKTQDVISPNSPTAKPQLRSDVISSLVQPDLWKPVQERMKVLLEPFSAAAPVGEKGTDLYSALQSTSEKHAGLRSVVLISDGDWNTGEAPQRAASALRVRGVPVYSVSVGSEQRLPDVVLSASDAPTFGVVNKALRIPFRITSWLPQDRELLVSLTGTQGETVTKAVRVSGMGQIQDTLEWKPTRTGDYTLTLEIPVDESEAQSENNRVTIPMVIRDEELRVLIIESVPRWEYRYLRNALERDPGVEVNCLLFHPDLTETGGGRGYLEQFPEEKDLFEYDVVFLGDVGVQQRQLTPAQCTQLRQLVRAQAGGLVFLPGLRGNQMTLLGTDLEELMPVVLNPAAPRGRGNSRPGRFALTEAGRRSLLTRLETEDVENERIWNGLPGFYWHAAAERARIGSQVLATHDTDSSSYGRIPLIVTRTSGTGKVLYMGSDGAWRWRKGVEDLYHYRFWGQVVRWMAYQRNMSQGESMRLFYSPDRPEAGSAVNLNVNVTSLAGEPLREGTVTVQITAPSGQTDTVRLVSGGEDTWGLFSGNLIPKEGGQYRLLTTCTETGARLETILSVTGQEKEQIGLPARPDVLREISLTTRGELTEAGNVQELVNKLAALPEPVPVIVPIRIWSHPLWAGLLILLLGVFWTARKFAGLA